ncbi:hypothetical protein PFISCL1PPCAC_13796, partial [Pristionchus fissidentatus]
QVKEAYYVAAAMQRAYLVTFLFKNFSNGIIVATCYRTDESQNCVPLLFTLQYAVIELIYVLVKHRRYLLSIWSLGYFVQFASHACIHVLTLSLPALPATKNDPQLLSYLVDVSSSTQFFSEMLEILIASERILSAAWPAKYYRMESNGIILSLITILLISCATLHGWLTESLDNSRIRSCSQVKEAYDLAVAMERAYLITFLLKNFTNGVVMAACFETDGAHNCVPLLFTLIFAAVE